MNPVPKTAKAAVFTTVLCGVLAAVSAFSQNTLIWTGAGDGTNIDSSTNWSSGDLPNANNYDTAEWNGLTTSNLFLIQDAGMLASGPAVGGFNLYLTANQTNSINIDTTLVTSPGFSVWNVTLDANAGSLSFGGTNSTHLFYMPQRPSGASHNWMNNSTNPVIINPRVFFKAGGGAAYTMDFNGTGNFIINNYLQPDNGSGGVTVQVDGPGTTTWTPQGYFGVDAINAVDITGGTLILGAPHTRLNTRNIANNGNFIFNAPSQSQMLAGAISGTGNLTVAGGTLTLQGGNSYTGNTILNGGELIARSAETSTNGPLGVGGTISFTGGTLGFSVSNTFDYSARFDTSAGQAYSFDTAGQNVTFASPLSSSSGSLTKVGAGTLTLAGANSYSGVTTVSAGELQFQGPKTGRGDITIDDGATLGVFATTHSPVTTGTLTVGTSSGATLEFDNVNSPTTPLLAANTLLAAGTITINVNSGTMIPGQRYPLLVWTNGPVQPINLGYLNGASGNLSITGNVLYLNVSPATPTLILAPGGNSLQLSWAGNFKLQAQTNSLTGTWVDYPGGGVSPVTVPVDPANGSVFFRLVSLP